MNPLIEKSVTQLIAKDDPQYFSQTCHKPYDRHDYKLVYTNGKTVAYDDYMDLQAAWFQTAHQFLSHVEVLDKKKKTKTNPKGF